MADDPPKKEVPPEVMIPTAPSTTQDAIHIETTISRERFAQLSGVEAPQICAEASKAEREAKKILQEDKSIVGCTLSRGVSSSLGSCSKFCVTNASERTGDSRSVV